MYENIAVIGISGRYTEAPNIAKFYENLSGGLDCIRPIPEDRKNLYKGKMPPTENILAMIENIENFDYEFFGMSLKEAEFTDPQQRILLQLSCQAIENAGYRLSDFRGTNTGVFVSAANQDYRKLFTAIEPTAVTGNLPAALGGRIAYELDLHGPSLVFDTACSSSLVAVYEAYKSVAQGEVEFALAGGINIFFLKDELGAADIGIIAPDGRAKAFSDSANGTGFGEGGGMILLKPLHKAISDKDNIQAIILGGAVNQDGGRSNGLTAPSPKAQTEVILNAWNDADISPETITFIETHGTGTKLGDPIEIQGITDAFRNFTKEKHFCAISSVKTNIGHLVSAAGIAGFTKCVLALKNKKLFPSLHFDKPNQLIDFENAPVKVNTELRDWISDNPKVPLRCAVSSFGLSGTNAHIVLEEAPQRVAEKRDLTSAQIVKISAGSENALKNYVKNIRDFVENSEENYADIAYTLNAGRDDHDYRFYTVAESAAHLTENLKEFENTSVGKAEKDLQIVFLLPHTEEKLSETISNLENIHPILKKFVNECLEKSEHEKTDDKIKNFIFQYAFYQTLKQLNVNSETLIGVGSGNKVVAALTGRISLEQAIEESARFDEEVKFDPLKLKALITNLTSDKKTLFINIGKENEFIKEVSQICKETDNTEIISTEAVNDRIDFLHKLGKIYQKGININWEKYYESEDVLRIEVPTYPFEEKKCWVEINPDSFESKVSNEKPSEKTEKPKFGNLENDDVNDFEKRIALIWGEILKVETLDLNDDYFDLGGDSLTGTQLSNSVLKEFNVQIEFEDIYTYSTVKDLAEFIVSLKGEDVETAPAVAEENLTIPKTERGENPPLSSGQERLWFLNQLEPENSFYNISLALQLDGKLDFDALQKSLDSIIERHEVLRTAFVTNAGSPSIELKENLKVKIDRIDLSNLNDYEKKSRAEKIAFDVSQKVFDLTNPPLVRVSLVKLNAAEHILVFVMHHIISDGWSINIFVRDFAEYYHAAITGRQANPPKLSIQYLDYAKWQKNWLESGDGQKQIDYWKNHLSGEIEMLDLPTDFSRPAIQHFHGDRFDFSIPSETVFLLKEFVRKTDFTLFMVLLASFQILLSKLSGQKNIFVGTPIAGRDKKELENLIGFFTNTLVMRGDLSANPTVTEFLEQIKTNSLKAFTNQNLPFEKLVEILNPQRVLNRTPLFQVMFVLQNLSFEVVELEGLKMEVTEPERKTSKFDLTLFIREAEDGLLGRIEYNTGLFSHETVENFVKNWFILLNDFIKNSNRRISNLNIQSAGEARRLVESYNTPARENPTRGLMHEQFENQVLKTPEQIALIADGQSLTFDELNQRANRLAHHLKDHGISVESKVGILLEHEADLIISILAVLKIGAGFVPVSPNYPSERIKYILKNSAAEVLITKKIHTAFLKDKHLCQMIYLDEEQKAIDKNPCENLFVKMDEQNLAYVIYTSGSTGKPKGVMINHGSVINLYHSLEDAVYSAWKSVKRVSLNSPMVFDAAIKQLIQMFFGRTLCLIPHKFRNDTPELMKYINENSIDVLDCTPSIANYLNINDENKEYFYPKFVLVGGENINQAAWKNLSRQYPRRFYNVYGPTETTVDAAQKPIVPEAKRPTIGRGISNVEVYILDELKQVVPEGVIGELHIGGAGLARGYVGSSDLTAEKFIPNPLSGGAGERMYETGDLVRYVRGEGIEFIERRDEQVKVRGYRIELGEIESRLKAAAGIREAAAVVREMSGSRQIVAYVVTEESAGQEWRGRKREIEKRLSEELPEYMMPARIERLEEIPKTTNGKIDRKALRLREWAEERKERTEAGERPRDEIEAKLGEIWEEVLQRREIGINDNFFDLGGDSILSLQIVARANQKGLNMRPRQLFQYQTISQLAEVVGNSVSIRAKQETVIGKIDLTPVQEWFFETIKTENHHWNQSVLLKPKIQLKPELLEKSVNAILKHHDALRIRFFETNEKNWEQVNKGIDSHTGLEFEYADLRSPESDEQQSKLEVYIAYTQNKLNLTNGPLIRFCLLELGEGKGQRLFVTSHHLIADGVSWRILLEDLNIAYKSAEAGKEIDLGYKTTSFLEWSEKLKQHSEKQDVKNEAGVWKKMLGEFVERSAFEIEENENTEEFARTEQITLSNEETQEILYKTISAQHTHITALLLTALQNAWSEISKQRNLLVMLEGHGRENIDDSIDTSRTVGWFTSLYPVMLRKEKSEDILEDLETVGKILENIPFYGINYGVLKYLSRDRQIKAQFDEFPAPQMSFNYLGQFNQFAGKDSIFSLANEKTGAIRSPKSQRAYLFEFGSSVLNGELQLNVRYGTKITTGENMRELLKLWKDSLLEIISLSREKYIGETVVEISDGEELSEMDWEKIVEQVG